MSSKFCLPYNRICYNDHTMKRETMKDAVIGFSMLAACIAFNLFLYYHGRAPKTTKEKVGDYTFEYFVEDGGAVVAKVHPARGRVEIPETLGGYTVSGIDHQAFLNQRELASVKIPETVTKIGGLAFCRSGITDLNIPDSVCEIGYIAFSGCRNLHVAYIGNGVTNIGPRTFSGCSGLMYLRLPYALKHIGEEAFSGCWFLEEVVIPPGVEEIDSLAFEGCENLKSVALPRRFLPRRKYIFVNCGKFKTIILPDYYD